MAIDLISAQTQAGLDSALGSKDVKDTDIAFVHEEGKEKIRTQGKDFNFVPSNGADSMFLGHRNGEVAWVETPLIDSLSYGVEWKPDVADPELTRVGNMSYHKTLPIQSKMKGCILNPKTKNVVYWLKSDDWELRQDYSGWYRHTLYKDAESSGYYLEVETEDPKFEAYLQNRIRAYSSQNGKTYYGTVTNTLGFKKLFIEMDEELPEDIVGTSFTIHFNLARLDGYDGEVFVYVPEFWIKSWDEEDRKCVRIAPTKIDDSWEHQPSIFIGAYRDTVLHTVPENMGYLSTLEVNTTISVANSAPYCRGGWKGQNDSYDDDPLKSTLGKQVVGFSRDQFREFTRKANKEIISYRQYKNIMYWLYVIEYANFNSQATYTSTLTAEGFHQGGLGDGFTRVDNWSSYNGNSPIVPNGYTNNIGNGTGVKDLDIGQGSTKKVNRWRGIEMPFGGENTIVDGVLAVLDKNYSQMWQVYTTDDPVLYECTQYDYDNMDLSGVMIENSGFIKEFDLGSTANIFPKQLISGYGSTYKCDYSVTRDSSTRSYKALCFGGYSSSKANAGLCYIDVLYSSSEDQFAGCRSVCINN